ncbi:MAG: hypothetical protein SF069_15735 [Phycisphaerae bacterium]|nr:hypothetical protein [Phycisphaerae bacterium]
MREQGSTISKRESSRGGPWLALAAILLLTSEAAAMDSRPVSASAVMRSADAIVHVQVTQIEREAATNGRVVNVRTKVLRSLRGGMAPDSHLLIQYYATVVCPPQPQFDANETLLVFLQRKRNSDAWTVIGGPAGQRRGVDAEYVEAIAGQLESLEKVVNEPDPTKQRALQVEWFMQRLSHVPSQPHALSDLAHCSAPHYAATYSSLQRGAATWNHFSLLLLKCADVPLDLAHDLTKEQKAKIRNLIAAAHRERRSLPQAEVVLRLMAM